MLNIKLTKSVIVIKDNLSKFSAMPIKLTIHKFDSDIQIQTMKITIDEDECSTVTFGDWFDSNLDPKTEAKSSRLVVKLVSGKDPNYLNIDSYAKKMEHNEMRSTSYDFLGFNVYQHHDHDKVNFNLSANNTSTENDNNEIIDQENKNHNENNFKKSITTKSSFVTGNPMHSPLECSLKKVEQNNAFIMKNITFLNKTLSYTKEREYRDSSLKPLKTFSCTSCGKGFVYETGLRKHYSIIHSLGETPRWQVVWTCVGCFQVWPRPELAHKHANICCKAQLDEPVKEIKTSLLLQCEFCEKVFTSIPQLLKHSKCHTTYNNYECTQCRFVFISYKDAEQHWTICPFLKLSYGFALSKMLLCNACDRKFKSYEQLYNHRYKVKHFATKFQSNEDEHSHIGILIYQCETCGEGCTSVGELLHHKQRAHPCSDYILQNFIDQQNVIITEL